MPVRIMGGFGGGLGKKSLILPDNIMNAVVATEREAITLTWTTPVSEVPIDHYNVYLLQTDTAPASIEDMQLVKTLEPTATSVRLDGLESGKMYYVVICSVSTEEFENASLRGMENDKTRVVSVYMFGTSIDGYGDAELHICTDGVTWGEPIKENGYGTGFGYITDALWHNGKIIYAQKSTIYEYDIPTKKAKSIYSESSSGTFNILLKNNSYMVAFVYFTSSGSGMIAKINSDNSIGTFVDSLRQDYCSAVLYGNKLVSFERFGQYKVVDMETGSSLGEFDKGDGEFGGPCCYGDGIFITTSDGSYDTSVAYFTEDKLLDDFKNMISIKSGDVIDIIYIDDWNCFYFAYHTNGGSTFYRLNKDRTMEKMAQLKDFVNDGEFAYANGRLFWSGDGAYSYYSVDGKNFVKMSGVTESWGTTRIFTDE